LKNHNTHITAPPGDLYWRKSLPPSRAAKVLLRSIGGVALIGNWYGDLWQYFTAWCPLPAESKE
jgi:hypothetical protein